MRPSWKNNHSESSKIKTISFVPHHHDITTNYIIILYPHRGRFRNFTPLSYNDERKRYRCIRTHQRKSVYPNAYNNSTRNIIVARRAAADVVKIKNIILYYYNIISPRSSSSLILQGAAHTVAIVGVRA